ncbi:MAG TPA: protein kinase [Longimicrobiaceae bacterium]
MAGLEGLLAGRVLGGRYLIEEVIGRGGMGAVYRALDERLGRRVAIKVITLAGGDADGVERLRARFHREARAAAALPHHPNIVPVYDYGTDEALGLDYIVMELLRGSDLATRIARSDPPPLGTALRILLQASRGLAVGHRAGLIHRDVKPGNIFITESDRGDVQVRVVDFGIAKLMDEEDTANQLTQDGRAPHSPAFASPEQLRGLTKLTPASDVFSLGAVGFLLLTGERPFSDADRNRMSLGMPVAPPLLRTSHPAIPATVEVVIQKALSFDPVERYADAGALLEALETAVRAISETTVEPYAGAHFRPPVAGPRLSDEERKRRAGAAEIAAGAAAGGASAEEDDDRTRILEGPPQDDRTLLAPPPEAPRAGALTGRAIPPRPPLEPRRSRKGLLVWLVVLIALGAVGVWAWTEMNQPEQVAEEIPSEPEPLPDIGVDPAVETVREPTAVDAFAFNRQGYDLFQRQMYDSALVHFRTAVEIVPDNSDFRRNLGLTLRFLGEYEEAALHLRRATQLDPTNVVAHGDLAYALLAAGDTADALQAFDQFIVRSAGRTDLSLYRRAAIIKANDIRAAQSAPVVPADSVSPLPNPDSVQPGTPPDSAARVIPAGGRL